MRARLDCVSDRVAAKNNVGGFALFQELEIEKPDCRQASIEFESGKVRRDLAPVDLQNCIFYLTQLQNSRGSIKKPDQNQLDLIRS